MARVQLHTLYSPARYHVDSLTSSPDSTLKGGARGEAAREEEEEEEEAREGAGAALHSLPGLGATLTPASPSARGRKVVAEEGAAGRRGLGEPRQPWSAPTHPPGPSALGLFHWRTMPKMVICVRGRECGFPGFRVTWRERDSLTGSRARLRPLPPSPGKGRGP